MAALGDNYYYDYRTEIMAGFASMQGKNLITDISRNLHGRRQPRDLTHQEKSETAVT